MVKTENWYVNSNNLRVKKTVEDWTPEDKITPEDEIKRLKAIIENLFGCDICEKDPDKCDYNKCEKRR